MANKIKKALAALGITGGTILAGTALSTGNVPAPSATTPKATHEAYANSCVLNADDTVSIYGEGGHLQYHERLEKPGPIDRKLNHAVAVSAHALIARDYNMDKRAYQLSCDFTESNGTKRVAQTVIEHSSTNVATSAAFTL